MTDQREAESYSDLAFRAVVHAIPGMTVRLRHVEPTGMSHIEIVSVGALAKMIVDELDLQGLLRQRLYLCRACDTKWEEEDLQQVQPDGRYACPFEACGVDTVEALS